MKTQHSTGIPVTPARKGKDKLPAKLEGFINAIAAGINAAARTKGGTVNAADFLSPAQIRMLAKMAEKDGKTPRQELQAIVDHVALTLKQRQQRRANAGGAA